MKRKRDTPRWIGGQFIPRTIEMLRSPAIRVLSLTGHRILIRLEIELAEHGGRENGQLPATYTDLEQFGVGDRHMIGPAIRELCALGFLELTKPGRAGNGAYRMPNRFRITYLPAGRKAPTHEWRRIDTMEEAERVAHAARSPKSARRGKKLPVVETPTSSGGNPTGHQWWKPHQPPVFTSGENPTTF